MTDQTAPLDELTPPQTEKLLTSAADPASVEPALRPRVRWAGIVWGLTFAAIAYVGILLSSTPGQADALAREIQRMDAGTAIAYGLIAVGALALVTGIVGLLRRAQRAVAARRRSQFSPEHS